MIQRFQIEDLIVQDSSGVVFRALDTDTGKIVAIRRFFPFGLNGDGLNAEEQAAYNISIARLSGLNHPALRSVVCGGCDPVDGMPYIATEWVDGEPLKPFIDQAPLAPDTAKELIINALEVSELLSDALESESVWVETDTQSIVVGSEDSGRRFTFWISPLKWLGTGDQFRGLESIVGLTEQIICWESLNAQDQTVHSLGGWLTWLRGVTATASLREAREALAALGGSVTPAPNKRMAPRAVRPVKSAIPIERSKPQTLLWVSLALVAIVAAMAGWFLNRQRAKQNALQTPTAVPALADTNESQPIKPKAEGPAKSGPNAPPSAAVIQWDNHEALGRNSGKPVIVEGVVQDVGPSKSGKTVYLIFSNVRNEKATRAGIQIKDSAPGPLSDTLKSFIGKKVQVSGTVTDQTNIKNFSSDVIFSDAGCIKVVP